MTVERETGRVIPLDETGRALLMHGHEPGRPQQPYWFTIGGAIEAGEDAPTAAARELFEETGIRLAPELLGEPVICDTISFSYDGVPFINHQVIFTCRIPASTPLTLEGLEAGEIDTVDSADWVELAELERVGQQIEGATLAPYVRACQQALAACGA